MLSCKQKPALWKGAMGPLFRWAAKRKVLNVKRRRKWMGLLGKAVKKTVFLPIRSLCHHHLFWWDSSEGPRLLTPKLVLTLLSSFGSIQIWNENSHKVQTWSKSIYLGRCDWRVCYGGTSNWQIWCQDGRIINLCIDWLLPYFAAEHILWRPICLKTEIKRRKTE